MHLLDLLDGRAERKLSDYSIVTFVGGFAFGDHLGAGFVFANKIRWRLYDQLVSFLENGGLALGICNGFQMMVRLGMVPGFDGEFRTPRATLAPNDRLGYWDTWVRLAPDPESPCVWTRGIESIELPTRHGEGKFLTESPAVLERLEANHQIAMRYIDSEDQADRAVACQPQRLPRCGCGNLRPFGPHLRPHAPPRRLPLPLPAPPMVTPPLHLAPCPLKERVSRSSATGSMPRPAARDLLNQHLAENGGGDTQVIAQGVADQGEHDRDRHELFAVEAGRDRC